jgi:ABC-type sugar transport system ATPase subunit
LIRFCGIGKRFPGIVALQDVTFDIRQGACHALMGENGAGKSTLGKILAGIYRPDEGHIELEGQPRRFHRPFDAGRAGIGIVHQELSYCPNLSVAENVCLAELPHRGPILDRHAMAAKAQRFLDEMGADCGVHEELGRLTTGQTQMVQIAAALATGARVLILDEPTSSLSLAETRRLEELIGRLRRRGTTILYVSHRMAEIFRFCDTVTVLRDGRHVATMPLADATEDELVRLMIGRPLSKYFPAHVERPPGAEWLRVESFSSPGKFRDVNFTLHEGEVLGMAGLVGSGRSEVAMSLFGLDRQTTGRIFLDGREAAVRSPQRAMRLGIGLVGEDRKRQGMIPEMSCAQNATLAGLDCLEGRGFLGRHLRCLFCPRRSDCLRLGEFLRLGRERRCVREVFQRLRVRAASPEVPMMTLSGGNQQKVVLAKCLIRRCRILMLDEPTRGVDVGAKAEIHRLIDELASTGHAVLMISSELPEVLHLSTRVLVMRQGRVAGILNRSEASQEKIMQLMAGAGGEPTEHRRVRETHRTL